MLLSHVPVNATDIHLIKAEKVPSLGKLNIQSNWKEHSGFPFESQDDDDDVYLI